MTISLMVELSPQLMLYGHATAANLTSWTIEGEDALVVCVSACVESIIRQSGKTWKIKSTFNISFSKYILFVLS